MEQVTELQEIRVDYHSHHGKVAVNGSQRAAEICRQAYLLSEAKVMLKEYAFIILLNRANKVIGYHKLSEGGITSTVLDPKLAFSVALKCLASGIILCHNHPSGSLVPSANDLAITKKFKEAGKLLDITLLDHIILTEDSYTSMADEGYV